ncbi:MAG: hypothetical protein ACPGLV_16810 [Bacteroidia bacterium]
MNIMQSKKKSSMLNKPIKVLVLAVAVLLIQLLVIQKTYAQLYVNGTTVLVQKNATLFIDADFETDKSSTVNPKVANWGTVNVTGNTEFHASTIYHGQGQVEMTGLSKKRYTQTQFRLKS